MAACHTMQVMNVAEPPTFMFIRGVSPPPIHKYVKDKTQSITLATDAGSKAKTEAIRIRKGQLGQGRKTAPHSQNERIPSELLSSFSAIFQIRGTPFALLFVLRVQRLSLPYSLLSFI